ncbi:MAG: hypothetical protein N2489_04405 [Clostridia bacterium]|nr:hypothetical protein [Clostridia bacterium]
MARKNKERRSANICLAIALLGLAAIVIPLVLEMDMMNGGYASIVIGAFVGLTGFLVFLMFYSRAKVFENMLTGSNLLAHWHYSNDFWQKEMKEEIVDTGIAKIAGAVLGGIFALIGIVVFFADTDENGTFLLIMLGVGIFFTLVGFVAAAANKKRLQEALPEALIAREGIYYKGDLYTWNQRVLSHLECVAQDPTNPSNILFVMRQLSGRPVHYHQHFISIPVPPGEEGTANNIVHFFNMPMSQEMYNRIINRTDDDCDDNVNE